MLKIALATIFYNNYLEMKRLIESIPNYGKVIDYWICIDGQFLYNIEKYPGIPRKSNDITIKLISDSSPKFNDGVIIQYNIAGALEYQKRNQYLEICKQKKIDVAIIIDTDEMFSYDTNGRVPTPTECWNRFKKNIELEMIKYPQHNIFGIKYIDESGTETYKPRIWVNPSQMRYIYNSHYHYANMIREKDTLETFKKNNICYTQQAQAIIKGVTLIHDHSLRTKEYQQKREEYQRYLTRFEELVQRNKFTTVEQAHEMAKNHPNEDFQPT